jgi:hypothetical protein
MKEVYGDLWEYKEQDYVLPHQRARVVTTNGTVTKGKNVMGGGCAAEAATKFPWLPTAYGERQLSHGNHVFAFRADAGAEWLLMMPVKHEVWEGASLHLIKRSAAEMVVVANALGLLEVIVPRPGSGLGGLDYKVVRQFIEPVFDDRFLVITFETERPEDQGAALEAEGTGK